MSDDNGKIGKKKQATKEEKEERIAYAMDLIAQGVERAKIVNILQEKFDIQRIQSYNYYNFAIDRFTEQCSVNLLNKLNVSIHTRLLLKRMAFEAGEIDLAHKVQLELDKFLGLNIIAPQLLITQDYIQFFIEELSKILIRNNTISDPDKRLIKILQEISEANRRISRQVALIGTGSEIVEQDEGEGGAAEPESEYFSIF